MASELKRFEVIAGAAPVGANPDRPSSMIGWVEHRDAQAEVPDDLTWRDVVAEASAPARDLSAEAFLVAADAATLHDAMRALSDASVATWGCDVVVWCITEPSPDSERVVFVRTRDGFDDLDAAIELAPVPADDLDRAVRHCSGAVDVIANELSTGDRFACTVWLAWREGANAPHPPEATLLRAAAVSLRTVWLTSRLDATGARPTIDLVRRDRREAAIGKLLCAAAPLMVAAHASLASAHASLRAELVGFRALAPLHASPRACASLLEDAWEASQRVWEGVSAIAALTDEHSKVSDPSAVIRAVAALVAPYVARRATVVTAIEPLPRVGVAPAYLAEALVMFVARVAFQFSEGASGTVRIGATSAARGVEIVVCAEGAVRPGAAHFEQDAVVAEVYGRDFAMRCGAAVDVLRDALGATSFRVVLPRV
jgi:hypothetical protein